MRTLFVATIALLTLAACSSPSGTPSAGSSTAPSASPNAAAPAMEATVMIQGFKFVPETVTIKKGGKVTWTNMDAPQHDAAPDAGATFTKTPLLAKGESGS